MSLTINNQYYQPTLGSLTGFDQIVPTSTNPPLPVTGWSVEQLRAFLLNQNETNFPSRDWVISVDNEITSHIENLNNPHQVSVDQISSNFVEQILQSLLPGTTPPTPPFYGFEAEAQLPLGDIFPGTYSPTNLYRLASDGHLEDQSSALEIIGTDFSTGLGGLPLFYQFSNVVPSNWATAPGTPNNTTVTAQSTASPAYCPGTLYDVVETDINAYFGINIPMTCLPNTVYTLNIFLLSSGVSGSVKIQQSSDAINYALVSLDDAGALPSSPNVQVQTTLYNNGIIKLSYAFLTSATPDSSISITFFDSASIVGPRDGLNLRRIFSVGYPTITKSALCHPTMVDMTQSAQTGQFSPTMNKITTQSTISDCMISLSLWMFPALPTAIPNDTNIMSFGPLSITRDQTNIYVKYNGTSLLQTPILNGFNSIALSYSSGVIILKDLINPRQSVTGTFSVIPTASLTLGPCGGYLISQSIYAISDDNECVEFLANV